MNKKILITLAIVLVLMIVAFEKRPADPYIEAADDFNLGINFYLIWQGKIPPFLLDINSLDKDGNPHKVFYPAATGANKLKPGSVGIMPDVLYSDAGGTVPFSVVLLTLNPKDPLPTVTQFGDDPGVDKTVRIPGLGKDGKSITVTITGENKEGNLLFDPSGIYHNYVGAKVTEDKDKDAKTGGLYIGMEPDPKILEEYNKIRKKYYESITIGGSPFLKLGEFLPWLDWILPDVLKGDPKIQKEFEDAQKKLDESYVGVIMPASVLTAKGGAFEHLGEDLRKKYPNPAPGNPINNPNTGDTTDTVNIDHIKPGPLPSVNDLTYYGVDFDPSELSTMYNNQANHTIGTVVGMKKLIDGRVVLMILAPITAFIPQNPFKAIVDIYGSGNFTNGKPIPTRPTTPNVGIQEPPVPGIPTTPGTTPGGAPGGGLGGGSVPAIPPGGAPGGGPGGGSVPAIPPGGAPGGSAPTIPTPGGGAPGVGLPGALPIIPGGF